MFAIHGYVVEKRKAPEGFITEPKHFRNYPQPNLPPLTYNKRCIETASDVVWAWGLGHNGRLALGERKNVVHTPQRAMDLIADAGGRSGKFDNPHREIPNYGPISSISLGYRHTLILTERGGVLACGHGRDGQLGVSAGDNPRQEQLQPIPVRFPRPVAHIVFVAAGGRTSYAISRRGQVYAWGCGKYGQLGLGDSYLKVNNKNNDICHRPRLIPELSSVQTSGVVHIAAGMQHAHALTSGGALYSWGHNGSGQLGLGDTVTRCRPVLVREFRFRGCTVLGVSTSSKFSMAIVEGPIAQPTAKEEPQSEDDIFKEMASCPQGEATEDSLHQSASLLISEVEKLNGTGDEQRSTNLLIKGTMFGRNQRGSTAPSSNGMRIKGNVGLYDSKPSIADYINPKNWSKTLVRDAEGKKLPAVTHTTFRPRTREAEFLGYEPEILSRPSTRESSIRGNGSRPPSRAATPAHIRKVRRKRTGLAIEHTIDGPDNISPENSGAKETADTMSSEKRAVTAPLTALDHSSITQTSLVSEMPFAGSAALKNREIITEEKASTPTELEVAQTEIDVVEVLFTRIDPTSEGPHILPNESVHEKGRTPKPQWLHCVAAQKELILEAAEDREFGLMGKDMIHRIETDPSLSRLRLLLVSNFIAAPLRKLSTEIQDRVTPAELIDLFLQPQIERLRMMLLRIFDLTLPQEDFQTKSHGGVVNREAIRRIMTSGLDARHAIRSESSLVSIFRKESYQSPANNPSSVWKDKQYFQLGYGQLNKPKVDTNDRRHRDNNNKILPPDITQDSAEEEQHAAKYIKPILYVKPRKKKRRKIYSKKARSKMLKKDLLALEEKEAEAKEKQRREIGDRAFEECQRLAYNRAWMVKEDFACITLDEFVDFVLVTAGRSPEGRSYDGIGCSKPPMRQAVFVWGFGDKRLGLGKEAADWFTSPGRNPLLRHQTLPRLCRPLTDDVDSPVEAISLGEEHGLVLTRDRRVYTWGGNSFCQLGLRDNRDRADPEELVFLEGCVDVAASRYWSMALRHTGEVYTWGQGRDGVLGHGEIMSRCAPHLVLSFSGRRIQHIAAGPSHAMAISGRAPTFLTARPEKKIRWHRRTRGVERWRLRTNRAARLRNGRDIMQQSARFRPPSFHFGFVPGERKRQEAEDLADQQKRFFRPKEIKFGEMPVLQPHSLTKIQKLKAEQALAEAFPRPPWLPLSTKEATMTISGRDVVSDSGTGKSVLPLHLKLLPASRRHSASLPLPLHTKLLPASRRPSDVPLSTSTTSKILPPLPLDIAVFEGKKSRFVFPVTADHSESMPREPLFDKSTIWHLVEGLDDVNGEQYVPDRLRRKREQLWREHRDRAFIERRRRKSAAIRIQAIARMFFVRNWVYHVWRRKAAATLLQRRHRGIRGRKRAQRRREEVAAIKVQQRIRGRLVFQKNRQKIDEARAAGRQKVLEKNSAIMVQKRLRGIIGRKRSQKLLKKKLKADRKAEKARRKAEAERKRVEAAAALREETLKKARSMYDPTGEMEDEEVIEIAKAMGGDWSGFGEN